MSFVLLVVLVIALLLTWWFVRKQAEQKKTVKRLYIAVNEGIAIVTMPADYHVEDMAVLWEFIQGKDATVHRARVHSLLYDCSEWRSFNVLGSEIVLWQAEPEWTGDTIFCQLSPEMKAVLDIMLEGESVHQQVQGNPPTFRPSLYFATVAEGVAYARGKRG